MVPEGTTTNLLNVQPTNGQTFTANSTVQFDLPARDGLFIDPKTMFIRYRVNYTIATANVTVRGIPAASHLSQLNEFIGSTPINSVYNYHQLVNFLINVKSDIASKYGMQSALGFDADATPPPALDEMESRLLSVGTGSYNVSIPLLGSAFASADKYLPTGLLGGGIRIQFVVAPPSDFLVANSANMTSYSLSEFNLCCAGIDMGLAVQNMVASMGPKLYLKCTGYANQGQTVPTATSGVVSLQYNHRLKSIENLYCLFSGQNAALDVNGYFDSRDITSSNGSLQLQVGSQNFPLLPIDTASSKTSVISYLRECIGSISDFKNSMAINNVEFSYNGSTGTTTAVEPAKFYFSMPLSKIAPVPYSNNSLLSGVDASSTPITLVARIGTATAQGFNAFCIAEYSLLVEIDPMTKQIQVIQ
jgi:hypothetical protein